MIGTCTFKNLSFLCQSSKLTCELFSCCKSKTQYGFFQNSKVFSGEVGVGGGCVGCFHKINTNINSSHWRRKCSNLLSNFNEIFRKDMAYDNIKSQKKIVSPSL